MGHELGMVRMCLAGAAWMPPRRDGMAAGLGGPARPRTTGGLERREGVGKQSWRAPRPRGSMFGLAFLQCLHLVSLLGVGIVQPPHMGGISSGLSPVPPYMVQVRTAPPPPVRSSRAGCRSSIAVEVQERAVVPCQSVAGCRGPIFPSEWMMRSSRSSLRSLASQQMALARPLGVPAKAASRDCGWSKLPSQTVQARLAWRAI